MVESHSVGRIPPSDPLLFEEWGSLFRARTHSSNCTRTWNERPNSVVSRWGVGANLGRSGPVAHTRQGLPGQADDAALVLAIIIEHAAAVGAAAPSPDMEFCMGVAAQLLLERHARGQHHRRGRRCAKPCAHMHLGSADSCLLQMPHMPTVRPSEHGTAQHE